MKGLSSENNTNNIQSFRLHKIDETKSNLEVILTQGKREQIVSEKTIEIERLLQNNDIDIQLIQDIIERVDSWGKNMLPPDFDSDKKYEDPLIQKMISILYKSHDAPFLREDYDTLKKIYLYIQHIQELKASIQQKKLDTGINIPRYYRTDIISKQWIADNAKNIEIMMNAFEKAGFTDEEISPPDRMDEVTRAEHYKNMRGNIFSILDDNNGNNNETDLMIANTGLAHKQIKSEMEELFGKLSRGARHYETNYMYSRQDEEERYAEQEANIYAKKYKEKHGFTPDEREEIRELAIRTYLARDTNFPRYRELQSLYPARLQQDIDDIKNAIDQEYMQKNIAHFKVLALAKRIAAGDKITSTDDLQLQANEAKLLEECLREIDQEKERKESRARSDQHKQKQLNTDNVSADIYKQLKLLQHYFLNRLDIKNNDGERITFFGPEQSTVSVDGLLYFRDHQEKDLRQRFLDRMDGKEQEAPVFFKGTKITDLTYGALEEVLKKLEDMEVAPMLGALLRYQTLPILEDKSDTGS